MTLSQFRLRFSNLLIDFYNQYGELVTNKVGCPYLQSQILNETENPHGKLNLRSFGFDSLDVVEFVIHIENVLGKELYDPGFEQFLDKKKAELSTLNLYDVTEGIYTNFVSI